MLRNLSTLNGFTIGAADGDIGRVTDFYFDDQTWTIRHLVVDTGRWLAGRQVLISPLSFKALDWDSSRIVVNLSKQQIENSPSIETDKPISRQREMDYYGYYGMPYYWSGPYRWGAWATPLGYGAPVPAAGPPPSLSATEREMWAREHQEGDPHLRSVEAVNEYYIRASDGDIGHVEDFVIDDRDWAIRYVVVDTRNWLPGKKVLVSPEWIQDISWSDSLVHLNLTRQQIENSPEYDPSRPLERPYETRLYDYYGRPRYWDAHARPQDRDRDRAA